MGGWHTTDTARRILVHGLIMEGPMTNDNVPADGGPHPRSMQDRFDIALMELVGMCHDGGLLPGQMKPTLKYWLEWCEKNDR